MTLVKKNLLHLGGPHAIYRIPQMFHLSKGKKVA